MSVDFFLFNVEHGQAAALRLPTNRWCLFDLGASASFSPWEWVTTHLGTPSTAELRLRDALEPSDRPYWLTVSHLHGDHLTDVDRLEALPPRHINTVAFDEQYVRDALGSATASGRQLIQRFVGWFRHGVGERDITPSFDGVMLAETSLSLAETRAIGGAQNSLVNNASIVTRIEYLGRSILLCGDVESRGWDALLEKGEARAIVSSVDVLVAPHHGHESGFSQRLLDLAQPSLVLVSAVTGDEHLDPRYSDPSISGFWDGSRFRRHLTTRKDRHITISIDGKNGAGDVLVTTTSGTRGALGPSRRQIFVEMLMGLLGQRNKS